MADNVIQVSNKLDGGQIFVIGGATYDEFYQNLYAILDQDSADAVMAGFSSIAALPNFTQQAATNLNQGGIPAAPVQAPPQYQHPAAQVQAPPPVAPVAAPAAGPSCAHGPRKWVTSKPGAPKKWQAWMCNAPQGAPDKCDPQWA